MENNKENTTMDTTVEAPENTEKGSKKKKTPEGTAKVVDDRVEVYIPKGAANDDPNLFVSVNGVGYLLPRGKKSMVPPHIKAEIDRSLEAQDTQDERVDALLKEASKPLPDSVG